MKRREQLTTALVTRRRAFVKGAAVEPNGSTTQSVE